MSHVFDGEVEMPNPTFKKTFWEMKVMADIAYRGKS